MIVRYVARRVLLLIPVLLGVSLICFLLLHLIPGDPVQVMLGDQYDEKTASTLRRDLGLDLPLPMQYLIWLTHVLRGDLGRSIFTNDSVLALIAERLPLTLSLAALGMAIALTIAIPAGTFSAIARNGVFDRLTRVVTTIGIAVPVFWSAILFILIFGLYLGWLPAGGSPSRFGFRALILPALVLGLFNAALVTRMTRATMVDVLAEQFITTARAKGLTSELIYGRHALGNSLAPIVTVIGLEFGTLLGGAVLTEEVFGLPGLGSLLIDSIYRRDFPLIEGATLVVALAVMLVNLFVDVTYAFIDPRIRY